MSISWKPPYIAGQRIFLSKLHSVARSTLLDRDFIQEPHRSNRPTRWETLPKNQSCGADELFERFLQDDTQFLCVMNEAGMGKSNCLLRGRVRLSAQAPGLVALITMSDVNNAFGKGGCDPLHDIVVEAICQRLANDYGHAQVKGLWNQWERLKQRACVWHFLQRHSAIMLIDGIDQTQFLDVEPTARVPINAVVNFINHVRQQTKIKFVIAGRPYAITELWDRIAFPENTWLAQMAYFDLQDQEQYLGPAFPRLRELDAEFIRIPRALNRARELFLWEQEADSQESPSASQLRTGTDVYRECVQSLVNQGFGNRNPPLSFNQCIRAFSVTAFEMLLHNKHGGLSSVDLGERRFLESAVFGRHADELRNDFSDELAFTNFVKALRRVNEGFEHAFLEDVGEVAGLYWRDQTLLDFFASIWAVRNPDAASALWEKTATDSRLAPDTSGLYWVWRFIAEADSSRGPELLRADPNCWLNLMAPYYQQTAIEAGPQPRQTEMIFRSWAHLQRLSASRDEVVRQRAQELITAFCGHPVSETDFIADFVLAPESEMTALAGTSGLAMKRFPVTHREFAVFDPSHDYSSEAADKPAVNISFYDAVAFCWWLSCQGSRGRRQKSLGSSLRLPSFEEWRVFCLAGSTTDFAAVREHDGGIRFLNGANFDARYCAGQGNPACYRDRSLAMPNAWDLLDMHGNVSEWVDSHGDEKPAHRLACGGSWRSLSTSEFAARRQAAQVLHPRDRRPDVGFRPVLVLHDRNGEE